MKVSESGYTKEELLEIVDTYLAEQSRRWDFIEEKGDGMYVYAENGDRYLDFFAGGEFYTCIKICVYTSDDTLSQEGV